MISSNEVRQKAERWWPNVLRSWLDDTLDGFFPKDIPQIGLDKAADKLSRFAAIQQEQEALHKESKAVRGVGYILEWTTQGSRLVGQNAYITRIFVETPDDFLRLIDRKTAFDRFITLASLTRQQVPELETWLRKYPLRLLENANDWSNWLAICRFFLDTYVPDRYYVRQLPLPVHTKFLEEKNNLLLSLLSIAKPTLLQPDHKGWRRRLGLLVPEPMIRTRALDERLRLDGRHEDFGLPLSAFTAHAQLTKRVFVCENLLNFLTLLPMPDAIAIWSGGGFNIECLAEVAWFHNRTLYYWGDLDAQGFQILNQFRNHFPNTQALLMDQATFEAHSDLVSSGEPTPVVSLPHLTEEERQLFNLLKRNNWRVEQEQLEVEWVRKALVELRH